MRRTINTIPRDEYYTLLRDAGSRMRKKISRLMDEERSMMIKCDNKGEFEKAEMHDFNERALLLSWNSTFKTGDKERNERNDEHDSITNDNYYR